VKGKVKSIIIIFLDIKGIVHKEFILAGQKSIPHIIVIFYGHCMKVCGTSPWNLTRTGCCITATHRLTFPFSPGNLLPKITRLSSKNPSYFPASMIEDKTERLNTLT
jgi:hypothetical protein